MHEKILLVAESLFRIEVVDISSFMSLHKEELIHILFHKLGECLIWGDTFEHNLYGLPHMGNYTISGTPFSFLLL